MRTVHGAHSIWVMRTKVVNLGWRSRISQIDNDIWHQFVFFFLFFSSSFHSISFRFACAGFAGVRVSSTTREKRKRTRDAFFSWCAVILCGTPDDRPLELIEDLFAYTKTATKSYRMALRNFPLCVLTSITCGWHTRCWSLCCHFHSEHRRIMFWHNQNHADPLDAWVHAFVNYAFKRIAVNGRHR